MLEFEDLWQLLYGNGSSNYYKHDCFELWERLSDEQQEQLYDCISHRLKNKQFVHYNPIEAIKACTPRARTVPPKLQQQPQPPAPTNYNGSRDFDALVASGRLCTAEYNGQVGIYTIEDATAHHMNIIKRLQP